MAGDRAPMLAATRAVSCRIGYYTCCSGCVGRHHRRKLNGRNRRRERDAWRKEAEHDR